MKKSLVCDKMCISRYSKALSFTKTGDSEDIDKYTAKKFGVLKSYTEKYKLLGGIVRQDKQSGELCICTETYSDDIKSDSWKLLSDIL